MCSLVLLQVKSIEASEPVTLSTSRMNPVSNPPSAALVQTSSAAVQNTARAMPKASNQAGAGVAVKGVKAAKTGEAARSRGVGCTPGGTSKAKSAAKGLAPATPATRPKQGRKAEPKKAAAATAKEHTAAAAGTEAALPHGDQQEAQGCGRKSMTMVIAPHLVQYMSPKKLAPISGYVHCSGLYVPRHVVDWYPGMQHGSPLHLQVKVPAAAEELASKGGTSSLEVEEARTSLAPAEEARGIFGERGENHVQMKLVLALDGRLTVHKCVSTFVGPRRTLDHFKGWRVVCMQKVSYFLNMV